jgi:hypothetical protein
MLEEMSVTLWTQNQITKRFKKSSRWRINKLKISSNGDGDGISIEKKNLQIQKAIPLLAQVFAKGFF